jgi:hypothetical protein
MERVHGMRGKAAMQNGVMNNTIVASDAMSASLFRYRSELAENCFAVSRDLSCLFGIKFGGLWLVGEALAGSINRMNQ